MGVLYCGRRYHGRTLSRPKLPTAAWPGPAPSTPRLCSCTPPPPKHGHTPQQGSKCRENGNSTLLGGVKWHMGRVQRLQLLPAAGVSPSGGASQPMQRVCHKGGLSPEGWRHLRAQLCCIHTCVAILHTPSRGGWLRPRLCGGGNTAQQGNARHRWSRAAGLQRAKHGY